MQQTSKTPTSLSPLVLPTPTPFGRMLVLYPPMRHPHSPLRLQKKEEGQGFPGESLTDLRTQRRSFVLWDVWLDFVGGHRERQENGKGNGV